MDHTNYFDSEMNSSKLTNTNLDNFLDFIKESKNRNGTKYENFLTNLDNDRSQSLSLSLLSIVQSGAENGQV